MNLKEKIESLDDSLFLKRTFLDAYDRRLPMVQLRFRNAYGISELLEELAVAGIGFICSPDPDTDGYSPNTEDDPLSPVRVIIDMEDPTRSSGILTSTSGLGKL
jgi:hypothetical protein